MHIGHHYSMHVNFLLLIDVMNYCLLFCGFKFTQDGLFIALGWCDILMLPYMRKPFQLCLICETL